MREVVIDAELISITSILKFTISRQNKALISIWFQDLNHLKLIRTNCKWHKFKMEGSILYLSLFFPTPLNFRRSLATFYIPSPTLHSIAILHDECKGMLWLCSPPRNALLMINMHFSAFSTLEISTLLLSDTALLWKPTYLPLGQLKVDQQN